MSEESGFQGGPKASPGPGSGLDLLLQLGRSTRLSPPMFNPPKLGGVIGAYLEMLKKNPAYARPVFPALEGVLGASIKLASTLQSAWVQNAEEIGGLFRGLADLPERTRESLLVMGQQGWYLDWEMGCTEPECFRRRLESGDVIGAEQEMATHFEERASEIQSQLTIEFPRRAKILNAAFEAHRNGQYELCIPVFLAQVDGICVERGDGHLFMKNRKSGSPEIYDYVKGLAESALAMAYISPLETDMPIGFSSSKRPEGFSGLNRHMVLHGESLDYGTRENSLRAISLLNYVFQTVCKQFIAAEPDPESSAE